MLYLDDILVTGASDQQHFTTCVKREFMGASMEYLGHQIDAEGLHTTAARLAAIQDASPPRNEQEHFGGSELLW